MMTDNGRGFLETIAGKYFREYGNGIRNLVFVFPNRRSAVYFRSHLQALSEVPLWSPKVFSINDLISECSGLEVPETYELIFELYNTYRKHLPRRSMSIETFFQTGKIILSDLNEIDKNLADTTRLFRALRELKGLEDPEPDEPPEIRKEYLELWEDLEKIYTPFRESLEAHHCAYEGMAFRRVAEDIGLITGKGWGKLIFAGFNALSGTEREILIRLQKEKKAVVITESDRYFSDDPDQEAGAFWRKYGPVIHSEVHLHPPGRGLAGKKKIRIVETTSDVGQVKYCCLKVAELLNEGEQPEDIGIILPDETLLFPILNSLPENMGRGNISMGYPLKQTSVFSLYEAVIGIHAGASGLINRKDLIRVMEHPYIQLIADKALSDLYETIRAGTDTFINRPENPAGLLKDLVSPTDHSSEFLEKFLSILDRVRTSVAGKGIHLSGIEKEFIFRFHTLLVKLNGIITRTGDPVSLKGFHRMFNDLIGSVHIPFTGEPLEGLQILGVLEMQNLKFNHLFILSMNEDHFPKGKHAPTFIPQDVRRAFGLPESGERESVYACHFYRMLAAAADITLLYAGVRSGSMAGERSRFIDQILMEYGVYNPDADIAQITADFKIRLKNPPAITVEKSPESLDRIAHMEFSPTSVRTWLECPLRFWFQYVLKLREDRETEDAHDPAKFGSISHKALEKIYQGVTDREIDRDFYSKFSTERVEQIIRESFARENVRETETGLNRITFEVIKKLAGKFLKDEEEQTPFQITSLEKKITGIEFVSSSGQFKHPVRLKGVIDRIDIRDGIPRVIDYKTGNIEKLDIRGNLQAVDFVKFKEVFQLLFYTLLLKDSGILGGRFRIGIYPFKTLTDTLRFVTVNGEEVLHPGIIDEFGEVLSSQLAAILDPKIPFTQTADEKHCRYCLHKNICERQIGTDRF